MKIMKCTDQNFEASSEDGDQEARPGIKENLLSFYQSEARMPALISVNF